MPRNEPKTGTSASGPLNKAKKKHKPIANEPKIELAGLLERICGIDLTQVVGLNVLSVLLIVSEIGIDMSKWRSAKAFCSWLGLCPGNKISGGKVLDSPTVKSSTEWQTLYDWPLNRRAVPRPVWASSTGVSKPTLERPRPPLLQRETGLPHLPPAQIQTALPKSDPAIYQLRLQQSALRKLQNQATTLAFKLIPTASVPA